MRGRVRQCCSGRVGTADSRRPSARAGIGLETSSRGPLSLARPWVQHAAHAGQLFSWRWLRARLATAKCAIGARRARTVASTSHDRRHREAGDRRPACDRSRSIASPSRPSSPHPQPASRAARRHMCCARCTTSAGSGGFEQPTSTCRRAPWPCRCGPAQLGVSLRIPDRPRDAGQPAPAAGGVQRARGRARLPLTASSRPTRYLLYTHIYSAYSTHLEHLL